MKFFEQEFNNKLYETIQYIESKTVAEVVVVVRNKSDRYLDISYFYSAIFSFLIYTIQMFIHIEINVYLIYFITILSFPLFFYLLELVPCFKRLIISKKRLDKSVEIIARAMFQKGGIHITQRRIGIFIYVSLFERKVYPIFDKGVIENVPIDELENFRKSLQEIFNEESKASVFLEKLRKLGEMLPKYLPPVENDINELPDNMKIEL